MQDICSRFQNCSSEQPELLTVLLRWSSIVGVVLSLAGTVASIFTLLFFKWDSSELNTVMQTVFMLWECLAIHFICYLHTISTSIYRKFRERDATIFHVQLCIALFCMLIIFVCGINRTAIYGVCVAVSALIHYFTLVAVMFMGAEAVLMFQKLVLVFGSTYTKFFVTVSLICWCKSV